MTVQLRSSVQQHCSDRTAQDLNQGPSLSFGYIREAGDSADCREMLKDIDRVVHDDDDADSPEAHDRVAGSARFTLKKDGVEFADEEYCTPYAGPQSFEHQALHLQRVRGCFGCDHGKALPRYKRRSKDRPRRDFDTVWRARAH